jgi:hypothetical protein
MFFNRDNSWINRGGHEGTFFANIFAQVIHTNKNLTAIRANCREYVAASLPVLRTTGTGVVIEPPVGNSQRISPTMFENMFELLFGGHHARHCYAHRALE